MISMRNLRKQLFIIGFLLINTLFSVSCSKDNTTADIIGNEQDYYFFTDDFESGNLNKTENNFKWSDNNVAIANTPNGSLGLKFRFSANGIEDDGWQEQRFHLGGNYSDLWIKYDLFIPNNFNHRCPVKLRLNESTNNIQLGDKVIEVKNVNGVYEITNPDNHGTVRHVSGSSIYVENLPSYYTFLDGEHMRNERTNEIFSVQKREGYGHNNKFMVIWQGDYGSASSGNSICFEYWHTGRNTSNLGHYPAKDKGAWRQTNTVHDKVFIDETKDRGKWIEVIFHIKVASSANNDGIIELWKNGEKYFNIQNLPNHSQLGFNYFDKGYLLGWANSGFDEETIFYIDNVVFSTNKISSKYGSIY